MFHGHAHKGAPEGKTRRGFRCSTSRTRCCNATIRIGRRFGCSRCRATAARRLRSSPLGVAQRTESRRWCASATVDARGGRARRQLALGGPLPDSRRACRCRAPIGGPTRVRRVRRASPQSSSRSPDSSTVTCRQVPPVLGLHANEAAAAHRGRADGPPANHAVGDVLGDDRHPTRPSCPCGVEAHQCERPSP